VCGEGFNVGDYHGLSTHLYGFADSSDVNHVMWLNKNITKQKTEVSGLQKLLSDYFGYDAVGLNGWMKKRFIGRFYGPNPHPFVLALQHPSRETLLGYVLEHQHFLRQWTRSCAYIIAKTDKVDVTLYELDNINTEFGGYGPDKPSHYELLLRMGESLGYTRDRILGTAPLPDTRWAIGLWSTMAETGHWLETMAAMHPLELIANRNLRRDGASIGYFDPSILEGDQVTEAAKGFLREGYEADVEHSEEALELIEKYAAEIGIAENVQSTFLRSIDAFDRYLMARLERAMLLERS
jgi:pyrroloquinoline-quinone synthase